MQMCKPWSLWMTFGMHLSETPGLICLFPLEGVCRLSWFRTHWVVEQTLGGTAQCRVTALKPVWQQPGKAILVYIKIFIKKIFLEGQCSLQLLPMAQDLISATLGLSLVMLLDSMLDPSPSPKSCQSPGQIIKAIPISKVWSLLRSNLI